jgi:hypothetical protein
LKSRVFIEALRDRLECNDYYGAADVIDDSKGYIEEDALEAIIDDVQAVIDDELLHGESNREELIEFLKALYEHYENKFTLNNVVKQLLEEGDFEYALEICKVFPEYVD